MSKIIWAGRKKPLKTREFEVVVSNFKKIILNVFRNVEKYLVSVTDVLVVVA